MYRNFILILVLPLLASFELHASTGKSDSVHEFCASLGTGKFSGIKGIPDVLATRGCAWMKAGIIDKESEKILLSSAREGKGIPASPEWIQAFTKAGDNAFKLAEAGEKKKNKNLAHQNYELASHFYYMARWPHTFSPNAMKAYQKHVVAYRKAGTYLNPPIQELKIPYDGKNIIAHLRLPSSDKPLPLIVFSPGIDDWKGEMNDFIVPMLKAGFATVVIDLPGTGESQFKLSAGSHKVFSTVITHVKQLPEIDGQKIGFYGLSGGGYFATAMALTDPNVKASVNIGGTIHYSFQKEWLETTPKGIYATITHCAGFNDKKMGHAKVLEGMSPISLENQGLLNQTRQNVPLLTINGERDTIAHPGEYRLLDEKGVNQDILIFEYDNHVAPRYFDIHIPFSIAWLKKNLKIQ